MPTIEEGLKILIDTVKNNVTHQDYKRVVALSEKYHQLITGEGIEKLMRQFSKREDSVLFKQRKDITQHITPSVSNTIMSPFYKVGRVNVIKREIDFENTESFDDKKADVDFAVNSFFGDKSLDKYLETRFVELSFSDPNSFIVVEYDEPLRDSQGNPIEKVKPFPWEVSSAEAVNYKYKNYQLQWLVIKKDFCMNTSNNKDSIGNVYTIYLENEAIKLTQIIKEDAQRIPMDGSVYTYETTLGQVSYIRLSESVGYRVDTFVHNSGRVPAIRIGYKRDLVTKGRTYVSPMESGVPYLMKMIKTVSEFDLTMCLHVFPQKIQYVPKCVGLSREVGCDAGKCPSGNTCTVCNGTGQMPAHTSAQDALFLRMPKDPADMINLENIMVYKSPPIELVKFQKEYIMQLALDAQKAVFNSDVFSRAEISATASEKFIELDNVYDTLFPFAEKFSDVWKYIVKTIASLRDITDVIVDYRFPKDFKFKSVNDLLNDLKLANESAAPDYIRDEIGRSILMQLLQDKPEEFKRVYVKAKFFPFAGKSSTEIIYIISNEKTTKFNEILWSNFEQIFLQLEMDAEIAGEYFYDYDFNLQKSKLDTIVNAMLSEITNGIQPPAVSFTDTIIDDNPTGSQATV